MNLRAVAAAATAAFGLAVPVTAAAVRARSVEAGAGLTLAGLYSTTEVVATALSGGLPVTATAGAQRRMLSRLIVPVDAGDVLDVDGRQRVTNDVGRDGGTRYTVGVSYYLGAYDLDDGVAYGDKTWVQLGPSNGDNVTVDRHHMPMHLSAVWQVPADWPAGHRIVVAFRADAASTQWAANGGTDHVTVDNLGALTVRRWKPGAP